MPKSYSQIETERAASFIELGKLRYTGSNDYKTLTNYRHMIECMHKNNIQTGEIRTNGVIKVMVKPHNMAKAKAIFDKFIVTK